MTNSAGIPFLGMRVHGEIDEYHADISLVQQYVNERNDAVEAVYTFPVPVDAVLLEVVVRRGERELYGNVIADAAAEDAYEDAVTDGKTAVLVEQVERGLYTVSLGNLLPGETVDIRYRYAQWQHWAGTTLRFRLPTVIAPRYGNVTQSRFAPHQVPTTDWQVSYPFSLDLTVTGALAHCPMHCPTHDIQTTQEHGAVHAQIEGKLDRDFVLLFEGETMPAPAVFAGVDGEGMAVAVHLQTGQRGEDTRKPCWLDIVLDCSGSMNGDSIAQARAALLAILDELREGDCFNITCFGTRWRHYKDGYEILTEQTRTQARNFAEGIMADMGGTQLFAVLDAVLANAKAYRPPTVQQHDILLITDGEVMADDESYAPVKASRSRVFTVGVGSSAAEDVLRSLARQTRGACILLSPAENMAQGIVQHMHHMYGQTWQIEVRWPGTPQWGLPRRYLRAYDADTLVLYAGYDAPQAGSVGIRATCQGETMEWNLALPRPAEAVQTGAAAADSFSILARMATNDRLYARMGKKRGQALAVRYQLVSPWTKFIMVDAAGGAVDAAAPPRLAVVPQMGPAGWGGMGTQCFRTCKCNMMSPDAAPKIQQDQIELAEDDDFFVPSFVRYQERTPAPNIIQFFKALDRHYAQPSDARPRLDSLEALRRLGLPDACITILRAQYAVLDERSLVTLVLHVMLDRLPREFWPGAKTCDCIRRRWGRLPYASQQYSDDLWSALEKIFYAGR